MIKFSRPSRLCDACRHMAMGVAIWRWVSPEVDTCRQMAMSVAVARYRRHKNLSMAMASPWREGSRRVATAVAKVVQQAHWRTLRTTIGTIYSDILHVLVLGLLCSLLFTVQQFPLLELSHAHAELSLYNCRRQFGGGGLHYPHCLILVYVIVFYATLV